MGHALSGLKWSSQFPIAIDLAHPILPATCQAFKKLRIVSPGGTRFMVLFCSLHPQFDLMSLTDTSHSWALFFTKSFWWNQSHNDWIKSKVQGIPESKTLQENLKIWDTPTPDEQPETQRGEMPWKGQPQMGESRDWKSVFSLPVLTCCTHHSTQLAWMTSPLQGPSPHSQEVCLFQSHHPHTQDGASCAARPLLHCTSVSVRRKSRPTY